MNDPKTINLDAIPAVNEEARGRRAMAEAIGGSDRKHKGAGDRKPSAKMRRRRAQRAHKAREARRAAGQLGDKGQPKQMAPRMTAMQLIEAGCNLNTWSGDPKH